MEVSCDARCVSKRKEQVLTPYSTTRVETAFARGLDGPSAKAESAGTRGTHKLKGCC
jgi:hypothetical protein